MLAAAWLHRLTIPGGRAKIISREDDKVRRDHLKRDLREILDQTLDARIERYLEVQQQGIIPNHYFAAASSECIDLYRDGCLLSAVMVSQAVAEGIWRFVLERNNLSPDRERPKMATLLVECGIISRDCAEAFTRIWRSFRNDVHHMNPSVTEISFEPLAKRNLADLGTIEREIFAVRADTGRFIAVQPKYWDLRADGTAEVFLRLL
jgi:hypothetical protein